MNLVQPPKPKAVILSREEEQNQFGVIAREVIECNILKFGQGRLIKSCNPYLLGDLSFLSAEFRYVM